MITEIFSEFFSTGGVNEPIQLTIFEKIEGFLLDYNPALISFLNRVYYEDVLKHFYMKLGSIKRSRNG